MFFEHHKSYAEGIGTSNTHERQECLSFIYLFPLFILYSSNHKVDSYPISSLLVFYAPTSEQHAQIVVKKNPSPSLCRQDK